MSQPPLADLSVFSRRGLPDALKTLLREFPRDGWESNPNFGGLIQFWLERHLMFRRLVEAMTRDTEAVISVELDPDQHRHRLQRYGSMLLEQLHGHHRIEDLHFFPRLSAREPRLLTGIELLESDHEEIDPMLAVFAQAANAVLKGGPPGPLRDELLRINQMLDRHLEDEEDLIVPILLKHGTEGFE